MRKFSGDLGCSNTGIDSRQGAKYAKFEIESLIILQTIPFIFSDLCGLGVIAGDIPSFGFAAYGVVVFHVKAKRAVTTSIEL